jgi:TfoX/Sxy family transcriptional regulator of competence genes
MNWTIGQQYELIEKGGGVYELGTLVAIHIDDTLQFKKQTGELHRYRIESNVTYRYKTSGSPSGYSE